MIIKEGRYGKFLACLGFPKCRNIKSLEEKRKPKVTDKTCPKCSKPLVERYSKGEKFLGCLGYPKCRYTEALIKISCPKCKEGELLRRRSKRGLFYGCSKYPNCTYTFNGRLTHEPCPNCNTYLIQYGTKIFCFSCNYTKEDK